MRIDFTINEKRILLRADGLSAELCHLVCRKDIQTAERFYSWKPFIQFATLEQAVVRLIDMKARTSGATTLEEIKAAIDAAKDEVCSILKTSPRPSAKPKLNAKGKRLRTKNQNICDGAK